MSAEDPIDVDALKCEDEDIYGERVKPEPEEYESDSLEPEMSSKSGKKGKSPYARGSIRRHPEDADTEDRVLVALVDSGGWE